MSARLSVAAIRRKLSASSRCYPDCPGWAVFNGREIQACDACSPAELTDADLARLPEARAALAETAVAHATPVVPAHAVADAISFVDALVTAAHATATVRRDLAEELLGDRKVATTRALRAALRRRELAEEQAKFELLRHIYGRR